MKNLLVNSVFSLLVLGSSVGAEASPIPPKVIETCQKAVDFKGCADAVMNGLARKADDSQLKQAMKKVGRRLQNGTNLRDSDEVFMPLIDAIAVATEEERKTSDFAAAEKAEAMFSIAQQTWQYRINSMIIGSRTGTKQWMVRHCKQMESYVKSFNSVSDAKAVTWRWRKNGIFGLCKWDGRSPDSLMVQAVGDFLVKP